MESLKDIVGFNSNFKTSINLYLSLNKEEKVLSYIPTKSSIAFLNDYFESIIGNKEQATLMIGPYGKGKSHLLLVLLAILSLERNGKNEKTVKELEKRFRSVDEVGNQAADNLRTIWDKKKRFLPVILNDSKGDLNQAFLVALSDALKRDGLDDISPDTYYSLAVARIEEWDKDYPDTYKQFVKELIKKDRDVNGLLADLKRFSKDALDVFVQIYPKVTAGSEFNPLAASDVLPLYKSISEKLVEECGYSGIYIVFDEFSKFIEGQEKDKSSVGNNMKLLQDMCELAADSQNAKIFVTMVAHKSIKEYGKYLSQEIINAFTGIEGRIIEKYFVTSSKNNYELIKNAIVKNEKKLQSISAYKRIVSQESEQKFFQLPAFKSNFDEDDFISTVLKGCYPFNPITAYLLLNISEKVAQNERTLFTFISNDEPNSMARFILNHSADDSWYVGADLIYDYFAGLFKKEVTNEMVHNLWLGAEYAISKCDDEEAIKLIKALAVVLIVNKDEEMPADRRVLALAADVSDPESIISDLLENKIIYQKGSTGTFAFKTRAGSALKAEIKRQRELKGNSVNYANALLHVSGKYYVLPKKYNTKKMITRYFQHEYLDVDTFLAINNEETLLNNTPADGKVITLYSFSSAKQDKVKKHVKELASDRLVFVAPSKAIRVEKKLLDYEIIQELHDSRAFVSDNEILNRELPLLEEDITTEVEDVISDAYSREQSKVFYYADGKVQELNGGKEEKAVNICCENLYYKSPVINNEIINRSFITTSQTRKARINIIQAILTHGDNKEFFAGTNQEATVYRSLFVVTGLRANQESEDLKEVMEIIHDFIESCSDNKRRISELVNQLCAKPYGMRNGVIPLYLAYAFAQRKEDLVVYFADKEVLMSPDIIVNMCESPEDYELFVSKEDLEKEKYINDLRKLFFVEDNKNLSDNRIKDIYVCMQRWFRALPQASRNLVKAEDYVKDEKVLGAMRLLKSELQQVEFNPYEVLFVTVPEQLATDSLEEAYKIIRSSCRAYSAYLGWIQSQVIDAIYGLFGGKKKTDLHHLLTEWYERQSDISKQGLLGGRVNAFMSCIENLNVYSDVDVAVKVAKAVTDIYVENWTDVSYDEFKEQLANVVSTVEQMKDSVDDGKLELSFTGKNGKAIKRFYDRVDEGTGSVLRNILEDTLEEYDDLSVNDRVAILLEMIEKIIG
nr:hypothetical protein [uncultured Butyrivibrio sp.]